MYVCMHVFVMQQYHIGFLTGFLLLIVHHAGRPENYILHGGQEKINTMIWHHLPQTTNVEIVIRSHHYQHFYDVMNTVSSGHNKL